MALLSLHGMPNYPLSISFPGWKATWACSTGNQTSPALLLPQQCSQSLASSFKTSSLLFLLRLYFAMLLQMDAATAPILLSLTGEDAPEGLCDKKYILSSAEHNHPVSLFLTQRINLTLKPRNVPFNLTKCFYFSLSL